ncbi:organic cation transporter protein-like [Ostrinia nubilalis]|uniref:organic cation transporter protein-like n=1 Tax=Ostrinia nubilalis TaxID=29057 RepID=UPI0030823C3C
MAEPKEKGIHLDDILQRFGLFGRYQTKMTLLVGFAFFTNGMHCINYIFVAEQTPYRCKIDACESQTQRFEAPWYNFTAPADYRNCYRYGSTQNDSECSEYGFDAEVIQPCTDWVYKDEHSFVSEFRLACQEWKRTFVGTIHSVGLMLGLFFQGQLSDKIGRKATIIIAGLAAALFGIAKSFANGYLMYLFLELMEATFGDNCSPAFIMSVELVHNDRRLEQQIFFSIIFAMGGVTIATAAYLLPYWRNFVLAIYLPSLLYLLYFFVMDESVRWLLSKGKKKKATQILLKMAKNNGLDLNGQDLNNIQCEQLETKSSPLRDTFRSKIVVKRFSICLIWWITCTFVSFGMVVNVVSLAGDKYINMGLMSLSDIPASFAMVYTLRRFQRKKPLFTSFMSAGVLCLIQPFVPKKYVWLSTGLYFLGRFVTTFTFATVYMYTSELFPTYTRNSMHALCSAIGRVGSILAPMTPLLTQYMESLPTLLIGGISIVAGLTTLLVPDLADEPLPDNVRQAENLGNNHLPLNSVENDNTKIQNPESA